MEGTIWIITKYPKKEDICTVFNARRHFADPLVHIYHINPCPRLLSTVLSESWPDRATLGHLLWLLSHLPEFSIVPYACNTDVGLLLTCPATFPTSATWVLLLTTHWLDLIITYRVDFRSSLQQCWPAQRLPVGVIHQLIDRKVW